jgi:hypothetical protein
MRCASHDYRLCDAHHTFAIGNCVDTDARFELDDGRRPVRAIRWIAVRCSRRRTVCSIRFRSVTTRTVKRSPRAPLRAMTPTRCVALSASLPLQILQPYTSRPRGVGPFYFFYEGEPRGRTRTQLGGDATISGDVNKQSTTLHSSDRASHRCTLPLQFITLHDARDTKQDALPQGDRSPHHRVACLTTACTMPRSGRAIVSTRCQIVLAARPIACDDGAAPTMPHARRRVAFC